MHVFCCTTRLFYGNLPKLVGNTVRSEAVPATLSRARPDSECTEWLMCPGIYFWRAKPDWVCPESVGW